MDIPAECSSREREVMSLCEEATRIPEYAAKFYFLAHTIECLLNNVLNYRLSLCCLHLYILFFKIEIVKTIEKYFTSGNFKGKWSQILQIIAIPIKSADFQGHWKFISASIVYTYLTFVYYPCVHSVCASVCFCVRVCVWVCRFTAAILHYIHSKNNCENSVFFFYREVLSSNSSLR